jgi:hypothetical protein
MALNIGIKMKISKFGQNLNFIICCDYTRQHDWMAFLTYYSIYQNLSEAQITLLVNRNDVKYSLFLWAKRCKIPILIHKPTDRITQKTYVSCDAHKLFISPEYICVRDFDQADFKPNILIEEGIDELENRLYSDCKNEKPTLFVSYLQGWGNFTTSKWIHTENCPLLNNIDFSAVGMTVNEIKLGQIWKEASTLFHAVSRR